MTIRILFTKQKEQNKKQKEFQVISFSLELKVYAPVHPVHSPILEVVNVQDAPISPTLL